MKLKIIVKLKENNKYADKSIFNLHFVIANRIEFPDFYNGRPGIKNIIT